MKCALDKIKHTDNIEILLCMSFPQQNSKHENWNVLVLFFVTKVI